MLDKEKNLQVRHVIGLDVIYHIWKHLVSIYHIWKHLVSISTLNKAFASLNEINDKGVVKLLV